MKCFYCDKEIEEGERPFYYGVEVPYINLKFHLNCAKKLTNIAEFIQQNAEKVYNIIEENSQLKGKKK